MPVRPPAFLLACITSVALMGCGENPPPRHAGDDAAPSVVRGAALDGSDDISSVQAAAPLTAQSAGGVPTLPPDEPVAALPQNGPPEARTDFVGPALEVDAKQPPGGAGAIPAASVRSKPMPDGPLGKPDPDRPDHLRLIFNELASFEYDPFEAGVPSLGSAEPASPMEKLEKNAQIPAPILALNAKKVSVAGFMVPIEIKKDQAKSFLLVRNQMLCCFGVQIGFNEWIFVEMEGDRRATFVPDVLVWVYGTLEVGEDVQDGMVMSIYRMKANEVVHEGGK